MTTICIHCIVTGLVQGVWYRATTQRKARALGLKGWVRNLHDGSVEVLICGEISQVNQLRDWLSQGPEGAKVSNVNHEPHAWEEHEDFVVL
ncbi:acylphosphatase [soil metagenome]